MALQDTYTTDPAIGFPGMTADTSPHTNISLTAEDAVAFGSAVAYGSDPHTCRSVTTGDEAGDVVGIAVRVQSIRPNADGTANGYIARDTATIMTLGSILVTAGETVTQGQAVAVTLATGAFGTGTGAGKITIADAVYDMGGAAGSLVKIRLK